LGEFLGVLEEIHIDSFLESYWGVRLVLGMGIKSVEGGEGFHGRMGKYGLVRRTGWSDEFRRRDLIGIRWSLGEGM
jgi:hypothetical protein